MNKLLKAVLASIAFVLLSSSHNAFAQTAVLEVGEGLLPATPAPGVGVPTPFTTIFFDSQFASPPNVFTMTVEDAANPDPCTIRIRNITTTSFEATCLEPINEDRASGGMMFEYIAIQDGGVTVPLASGTGSVDFVSSCLSTANQVYGGNCVGCSGAQAFSPLTFPSAFTATPSLLTQVQTTNNQVAGEPSFIDVAVRTGSLTTSGVDVSIEQMEAGTGPLAQPEEICYLAVERDGCQELDLSSFGGPASMLFRAENGGTTVDGHDNGCTAGEGVNFSGCFTGTPIALAKQISRRGGDGGILRRCDVNQNEIILTYDEDQVSNAERGHVDEIASAFAFASAFTTPVSFTQAKVVQQDRRVKFEWATSSETFHLGFDLWGEFDGEWQKINRRFIVGSGHDTALQSDYRHTVKLTRQQANTVSRFAISSLDSQGQEDFFGPFESDIEYGSDSPVESVDWRSVAAQYERQMRAQGYVYANQRWRKVSVSNKRWLENSALSINRPLLNIEIQEAGLQRISGASIIAQLPSLDGVELSRLAVSLNDTGVARFIDSQDDRFDATDSLIFYAKEPTGKDAIYLNNYAYQLTTVQANVIDASRFDARVENDVTLNTSALRTITLTSIKEYSASLNGSDPWFDKTVLASGGAKSQRYNFDLADSLDPQAAGELTFSVYGGIDFPSGGDDHHVQIRVNGTLVHDDTFDGFTENAATVVIPPNTLKQTSNWVDVVVPNDAGFIADMILIDTISVHAPVRLLGSDNARLDFRVDALSEGYDLAVDYAEPLVFAYTREGALSVVERFAVGDQGIRLANPPAQADTDIFIAVRDAATWSENARLVPASNNNLHTISADYLVVAHPTFMGPDLDDFVALKQQQGHKVQVVNWLEIVATYGFANHTPDALNNYLRLLTKVNDIKNVLLVGGHSFDYRGITNDAVLNFIPSHTYPASILKFAPTDTPYADLDGDKRPDFAIGRWPVRSVEDMNAIVKKTRDWHQKRIDEKFQDAILIAQAPDNRRLEFADQIRGRVGIPLSTLSEFDKITMVDMKALESIGQGDPIALAQQQIRTAIEDGADLISFAGHASPAVWGFQGIVNTDFVRSLENQGNPLVVMPLACYTTNFESASVNTLAHQWLFSGDSGAAAIHGASVLGDYRENAIFAERILQQAAGSTSYGEAILKAKQLAGPDNVMQTNWVLLGDPALPLR